MLKTNSKKARENIRAYIIDHFTPEGHTDTPPETWPEIARFILENFRREKYSRPEDFQYYGNSESAAFIAWAGGLPSLLDTCYLYNRPAAVDLAFILEETETESSKYSESAAENLLTLLIYRELKREDR